MDNQFKILVFGTLGAVALLLSIVTVNLLLFLVSTPLLVGALFIKFRGESTKQVSAKQVER